MRLLENQIEVGQKVVGQFVTPTCQAVQEPPFGVLHIGYTFRRLVSRLNLLRPPSRTSATTYRRPGRPSSHSRAGHTRMPPDCCSTAGVAMALNAQFNRNRGAGFRRRRTARFKRRGWHRRAEVCRPSRIVAIPANIRETDDMNPRMIVPPGKFFGGTRADDQLVVQIV